MAITLGEAILYLRGDGSDLDKSLKDADKKARGVIGGMTDFANRGFTGLKKAVGVGLVAGIGAATAGIAALGAGLVGAVSAGSDVEEMMGKFSVVFANTGDRVTSQLDEFGRAVGRNKYELREMAATFGDTLKPMGFAESDAADLSVTLSKLAVDLGSFNNMETDEALRRLQGTLIGSHENALAFGVVINENTLKAEMARNGWDKLTGAALEQAKVQARINLLMAGTTDAQGDAARTSAGWANQMRRLQSILQETQAEIGTKLLPVLTPLLTKLGDLAGQFAPQAIDAFIRILDQVVAFTVALLGWDTAAIPFLGTLTGMYEQVMAIVQPVLDVIGSFVSWQDVLIALGIVAASIVIPILAGIVSAAAPVIAVGAALVASVALVRNAWEKDWGGIRTALTGWWDGTGKPIFGQLQTWLADNLPAALSTLQKYWQDYLLPALRQVWTFIDNNIIPLLGALINVWFAAMRVQLAVLAEAWKKILLPALRAIWAFIDRNVIPIFKGMSDSVGGVSGVIQTVIGWLEKLAAKLNSIDFSNPFGNWHLPDFNIPGFAAGTNFAPGGLAIAALDWADWIGGALDWADWIGGALDWADWIGGALDWDGFLTLLDWQVFVWKLEWSAFVSALDWAAGWVTSLDWGAFVVTLSDWGTWISSLDWTKIITTVIDWATWIPALTWNSFVSKLEWPLIAEFDWGSWIASFSWPSLPTFYWRDWIFRFLWPSLPSFSWSSWISSFNWPSLPSFSWSSFIPALQWPSIPEFKWPTINLPGIPGFATGTNFAPGGLALVGEQGPELVRLPRGARVDNASRTAQLANNASSTVNITNNVTVNSEQDIALLTEQIVRQLRKRQTEQAWQPTF